LRPFQVKIPFDGCCKNPHPSIAQNGKILLSRHLSAKEWKDVNDFTVEVLMRLLIKNLVEKTVSFRSTRSGALC